MFLKTYLDLCLLRANPQDLPGSNALPVAALAAYGLVDVVGVLDIVAPASALMAAVADTLMLVAATHLALRWRRLENRFSQTLAALAGCGAILSLVVWAVANLAGKTIPPEWIWVPYLVWYTLVFGHVLRHALSIPMLAGIAAGILYLMLSLIVIRLFIHPISMEP
ncbi:MAG TPA: hypothetical protein VEI74_00720 [Candidatus Methylomirabilis sp.]|nr:hypothetical protein [Candidatus Methylomirabilis sp.]